jgi:hypothetical protein
MEKTAVKIRSNAATLIAAALIIAAGTAILTTSANNNDETNTLSNRPEIRDDIKQTIETGDYETFQKIAAGHPGFGKIAGSISEDDFGKLAEAHDLMQSGKTQKARAILEELDIPHPFKNARKQFRRGVHHQLSEADKEKLEEARELRQAGDFEGARAILEEIGMGKKMFRSAKHMTRNAFTPETRESILSALKAGDYEAWVSAISSEKPEAYILKKVNEENFGLLAEMQNAKAEGDFERAKEIAQELELRKRGFRFMK